MRRAVGRSAATPELLAVPWEHPQLGLNKKAPFPKLLFDHRGQVIRTRDQLERNVLNLIGRYEFRLLFVVAMTALKLDHRTFGCVGPYVVNDSPTLIVRVTAAAQDGDERLLAELVNLPMDLYQRRNWSGLRHPRSQSGLWLTLRIPCGVRD